MPDEQEKHEQEPLQEAGPVLDVAVDTPEKKMFREALKSMGRDEIMKIPEERFRELIQWIITDTAFLLREPSEHRVLMVFVAGEYPEWYEAFVERLGGRL